MRARRRRSQNSTASPSCARDRSGPRSAKPSASSRASAPASTALREAGPRAASSAAVARPEAREVAADRGHRGRLLVVRGRRRRDGAGSAHVGLDRARRGTARRRAAAARWRARAGPSAASDRARPARVQPARRTRRVQAASGRSTTSSSSESCSSSASRGVRARLVAHARDRLGIELAELARASRAGRGGARRRACGAPRAARRRGRCRAGRSGSRAPAARARWSRGSAGAPRPPRSASRSRDEPVDVGRLVQAVVHRLAHERVIGDLDRPGAGVLLAAGQRREDRGHQVVGLHALDRRRVAPAAALAQHHERAAEVPAPAHLEHRREQQRLGERLRAPFAA